MKTIFTIASLIVTLGCMAQQAGSNKTDSTGFDPIFPDKKNPVISLTTSIPLNTPPPIAVSEFTYGFSKHFSMGAIVGTTGVLALYGVKINALLYQKNNFRAHFRMPIIYYPERSGKFLFDRTDKNVEPWMLSLVSVCGEWKTKKGLHWTLGAGVVETHCTASMMGVLHKWGLFKKAHGHDLTMIHENSPAMLGVFNTFHGGVIFPLGKKWMAGTEIITVMNGFKFSKKNEFRGGFPINPLFQVYYKF